MVTYCLSHNLEFCYLYPIFCHEIYISNKMVFNQTPLQFLLPYFENAPSLDINDDCVQLSDIYGHNDLYCQILDIYLHYVQILIKYEHRYF